MERAILNDSSTTTTIIVMFVGGMVVLTLVGVPVARRVFPDLGEASSRMSSTPRRVSTS